MFFSLHSLEQLILDSWNMMEKSAVAMMGTDWKAKIDFLKKLSFSCHVFIYKYAAYLFQSILLFS